MKISLLVATAAMAAAACTALADYEEVRELSLDAESVETLRIRAGAGRLDILGDPGAARIDVTATVRVSGSGEGRARTIIEDGMDLRLEARDDLAELTALFRPRVTRFGANPAIDLELRIPAGLALDVEDGSGPIVVRAVQGDIRLVDGSGSIEVLDAGAAVWIEDGSGSIAVRGTGGEVTVRDGSGSILLERIGGDATVYDGSGSIEVRGVAGDLRIPKAGSGSVSIDGVEGRIERED